MSGLMVLSVIALAVWTIGYFYVQASARMRTREILETLEARRLAESTTLSLPATPATPAKKVKPYKYKTGDWMKA